MSSADLKFRDQVRESLELLGPRLESVLEQLTAYPYPPEVFAIDFEVFSDGFTQQFPVRCFFMDKNNCEYFVYENGKATYPSPVDPGLLSIDEVYSSELEEELEEASPDSDPWNIATEELFNWFLARWRAVGGSTFGLAATIAHHDSSTEINLLTGARQPRASAYSQS